MRRPLVLAAAMLIGAAAGSAFAQTPQRTTATYEDWTMRCALHGAAKVCEMQPVTQIAIGRQGKSGPLKIAFQVPVNVWLPAGVRLTSDDGHAEVAAGFSRCVPAGCIAETAIKEGVIATLRTKKKNGSLRFKQANKQDVAVPVSFKGFGDAYDAMLK